MTIKRSMKYQLRDGFDMSRFLVEIQDQGFSLSDIKVEKDWEDFRLYIFAEKWVNNAD